MVGMHIHIIPNRNSTPAVLLRESYRVGGNVRKRTLANLSKLPMDAVDAIRRILKGEKLVSVEVAFKIVENGSLHHGHVDAVLSAMRQLGFRKARWFSTLTRAGFGRGHGSRPDPRTAVEAGD